MIERVARVAVAQAARWVSREITWLVLRNRAVGVAPSGPVMIWGMRALTVRPHGSPRARVEDVPEPPIEDGPILVETIAVGVCGTDREIVGGGYGTPPDGRDRLILGHESLGRVLEAPDGSGFETGDLVVGIVRRPDPVPCPHCASGEWDMCANGRYTERGIARRDGFCSERYRIEPAYAVKVDRELGDLGVLLEPASVVAKAWEQVDRAALRAVWEPRRALVLGAGPIGLLGALFCAQRGLEVHVVDKIAGGPRPELVTKLGGVYHDSLESLPGAFDVAIECTGVPALFAAAIDKLGPGGVTCLVGLIPSAGRSDVDLAAINRQIVLSNKLVVGSVSGNRRHFHYALQALRAADRGWLGNLITDQVSLDRWQEPFEAGDPNRIKAVIHP